MTHEADVRPPVAVGDLDLKPEIRDYVYWRGLGLTAAQAYRRTHPNTTPAQAGARGRELDSRPEVQKHIRQILDDNRIRYNLDRDHVVEGLLEAVSIAREQSDPKSMISGWTEIGRIVGANMPKASEKALTHKTATEEFSSASDAELLKLLKRSRQLLTSDKEAVEGEFIEVPKDG